MKTKTLYIVAGGTDGYVDFFYTFSNKAYNKFYGDNDELHDDCEWQGNVSTIQVPEESTYESLGITNLNLMEDNIE